MRATVLEDTSSGASGASAFGRGGFARGSWVVRRLVWVLGCLPFVLGGCKLFAVGEVNQIAVAISSDMREVLGEELREALEPYEFTNREERVLDVAYVDPADPMWRRLRLMRHVLLIGERGDPLVAEAVATSRRAGEGRPGSVLRVEDVWARRQVVTIALIPEGASPSTIREIVAAAGDLYRRQFDELVDARATLIGFRGTAASLFGRPLGFSLRIPAPFQHDEPLPGTFRFRSSDPSEARPIIRTISVSSRPHAEVEWTARSARAWRSDLGARLNQPPQVTESAPQAVGGRRQGRRAIELRGAWSNPPGEWPAAGPFVTWMIDCEDRVYLLDAWLYAPASDKYELLRQLETVMGTFRCGRFTAASTG